MDRDQKLQTQTLAAADEAVRLLLQGRYALTTIGLPDELLELLKKSRLTGWSETDQVRFAAVLHLFQEDIISVGRAAELATVPLVEFEWLLVELGIPVVRYDLADYEVDQQDIAVVERSEAL